VGRREGNETDEKEDKRQPHYLFFFFFFSKREREGGEEGKEGTNNLLCDAINDLETASETREVFVDGQFVKIALPDPLYPVEKRTFVETVDRTFCRASGLHLARITLANSVLHCSRDCTVVSSSVLLCSFSFSFCLCLSYLSATLGEKRRFLVFVGLRGGLCCVVLGLGWEMERVGSSRGRGWRSFLRCCACVVFCVSCVFFVARRFLCVVC
jgi:hypothetical protein